MLVPKRIRSLLAALFRQHWRIMLVLLGFATLQAAISTMGDPLLMKWLVDSLSSNDLRLFAIIGCSAVAFYTVTRLLDYAYTLIKTRVRLDVTTRSCRNSAALFYRQPYAEVKTHDKGYYSGRILDESKELSGLLDTAIDIHRAVIGFVSALAVCLWLSWQLALGISVIVPVLLYAARRYSKRISQSSMDVQETEAQLRDTLGQLIGSYKLFNIVPKALLPLRALNAALDRNMAARMRITRHSSLFQLMSGILLSYAEMAVLLAAGYAVITGHITIGGLFGFMSAYWRAVGGVQRLIELTPQLARLEGLAQRLEEFTASALPEPGDDEGAADSDGGRIRLDDVALGIGDQPLLSGLSLDLAPGERLLVIGANGSGKSTFIDMLCGFRPPGEGRALLPAPTTFSCQFTEPGFFPGTVRENLASVAEGATDEWLQRCELDAVAGQQPYQLSAGQQRKLQIAMALARDTDSYVFDEPLANLDEDSKARFFEMILQRTQGRTLIVVMHGDNVLWRRFDRILDLGVYRDGNGSPAASAARVANA